MEETSYFLTIGTNSTALFIYKSDNKHYLVANNIRDGRTEISQELYNMLAKELESDD